MQYSTTTVRYLTRVRRRLLNIMEFYPIGNYCEINEKPTFIFDTPTRNNRIKHVPIFIIAFVDLEELTRNIKMLTEIYIEKCDIFGQFKTLNMQNRLRSFSTQSSCCYSKFLNIL